MFTRALAAVVPVPLHDDANEPLDEPGKRVSMSANNTQGVLCAKNGNMPIVNE
jgi:hypothetical protein